jgi:hypothetical protein
VKVAWTLCAIEKNLEIEQKMGVLFIRARVCVLEERMLMVSCSCRDTEGWGKVADIPEATCTTSSFAS